MKIWENGTPGRRQTNLKSPRQEKAWHVQGTVRGLCDSGRESRGLWATVPTASWRLYSYTAVCIWESFSSSLVTCFKSIQQIIKKWLFLAKYKSGAEGKIKQDETQALPLCNGYILSQQSKAHTQKALQPFKEVNEEVSRSFYQFFKHCNWGEKRESRKRCRFI